MMSIYTVVRRLCVASMLVGLLLITLGGSVDAQDDGSPIVEDASTMLRVRWSPDDTLIAVKAGDYGGRNGPSNFRIWIVDAVNGNVVFTMEHNGGVIFEWSPDSQQLYITHGFAVDRYDRTTNTVENVLPPRSTSQWYNHPSVSVSPDGTRLAILFNRLRSTSEICVYDTTTWELIHTIIEGRPVGPDENRFYFSWAGYSPNGAWLAATAWDGYVYLWNAVTFALEMRAPIAQPLGNIRLTGGSWRGMDDLLAIASTDGHITVWNARTNQIVARSYTRFGSGVRDLSWHPDGQQLVRNPSRTLVHAFTGELRRFLPDEVTPFLSHINSRGQIAYGRVFDEWVALDPQANPLPIGGGIVLVPPLHTAINFTAPPMNGTVGSSLVPVSVQVWDDQNSPVGNIAVELVLSANPSGTLLSGGDVVLTNANGEAVFPNLRIDQVGEGYTLAAVAGNIRTVSLPFNVLPAPTATPAAAATLTPTLTPTPTPTPPPTATPSVSCTVTVAAGDALGLVNAINAANASSSPATICLTSGTYTFHTAANGIALPAITRPVTIIGSGAILERASGAPNFRLFSVTADGALTLQNMTIRNFNAGGENGGAILSAGTLTLDGVTLSGHSGRYGGAIHSIGTVTVRGSTLTGNRATEQGGAIHTVSGSVTVSDSVIESNSARYGSGVYAQSGTVILERVSVRTNSANEQGAGVFLQSGTLTVTGGGFENNSARYGGAIYSGGTLTVSGTTFSGNSAVEDGGAIYQGGGSGTAQDACFAGNTARFGAGVYSTTAFDARESWWGSASGPTSAQVSATVQTVPFLTAGCPN